MRKAGRLQVIKNKCPWCWAAAYVTAGFGAVKQIFGPSYFVRALGEYFSFISNSNFRKI